MFYVKSLNTIYLCAVCRYHFNNLYSSWLWRGILLFNRGPFCSCWMWEGILLPIIQSFSWNLVYVGYMFGHNMQFGLSKVWGGPIAVANRKDFFWWLSGGLTLKRECLWGWSARFTIVRFPGGRRCRWRMFRAHGMPTAALPPQKSPSSSSSRERTPVTRVGFAS
jgi:hypothetical protein